MPTITELLRALLRANDDMAEGEACWCTSKKQPREACEARRVLADDTRTRAAAALEV